MRDVFLSYSGQDDAIANILFERLSSKGISVFYAAKSLSVGQSYAHQIINAISEARIVVILLTRNSIMSRHVLNEIDYAVQQAESRAKIIVPVKWDCSWEDVFKEPSIQYYLSTYQFLSADSIEELDDVAERISEIVNEIHTKNVLSDKLSEYLQIGADTVSRQRR